MLFQLGNYLYEALRVGEILVHGGKTYVRDMVGLFELFEYHIADLFGRNFLLELVFQLCLDVIDHIFDAFIAYRALDRSTAYAFREFYRIERFDRVVFLDDHERDILDDLIGGKSALAGKALSAAAYPAVCGAGIYNLAVFVTAFGTSHSEAPFGGYA